MSLKFNGESGRRPSAEARRWVYLIIRSMIATDAKDPDGWLLGGIEEEADRRRIRKAVKAVSAEMLRKGNAP